jgi:hypothetical protein
MLAQPRGMVLPVLARGGAECQSSPIAMSHNMPFLPVRPTGRIWESLQGTPFSTEGSEETVRTHGGEMRSL